MSDNEQNSTADDQNQAEESGQAAENTAGAEASGSDEVKAGDAVGTEQGATKDGPNNDVFEPTLPEGSLIEDKGEFFGILKDATQSQEGFDKLMGYVGNLASEAEKSQTEAENTKWENTKTQWKEELQKDESFGKDVSGNTQKALDAAKSIGLDGWLKETNFDKNPDVLRAMFKLHEERADAKMHAIGGKQNTGHPKNPDGSHKLVFDGVN